MLSLPMLYQCVASSRGGQEPLFIHTSMTRSSDRQGLADGYLCQVVSFPATVASE